ncbi:hypothetical protein [Marinicella meishanensis]|uniref:hypothetical protein n=1 Tax=Marinicella meishanensis TaxID=2873263 RepID=UPI001CC09532|nr:hypothetical protein [Marinicella sp. NBU2979]
MYKHLTLILAMLWVATPSAFTLNQKLDPSQSQIYLVPNSTELLGDRLIYSHTFFLINQAEPGLYAWDLDSQEIEKLVAGELVQSNDSPTYFKQDNTLFFLHKEAGETKLWQTDGTPAGSALVYPEVVYPEFNTSNDLLYMVEAINNRYVVTDGQQAVVHEVALVGNSINDLCAYTTNHIIGVSLVNDVLVLVRSDQGGTSTIDLVIPDDADDATIRLVGDETACYAMVPNFDDGTDLWRIAASGEITSLNDLLGANFTHDLLMHEGRLYVRQSGGQAAGYEIKRLNQAGDAVDATFVDFDDPSLVITDWYSVGPYIAIDTTRPDDSDALVTTRLLARQLPDLPLALYHSRTKPLTARSTNSASLLTNTYAQANGLITTNVLLNPFAADTLFLSLPLGPDARVLADGQSDRIVVATNNMIYEIEDTPDIGTITKGAWIDPTLENQGLVIQVAQRNNGSEYVFVTGYTFLDGQPFWFAGNAELNRPISTLSVDVFQYDGIGLFAADATPNQTPFANLELTMTACDRLSANIVTSTDTYDLDLYRVDDRSHNQLCQNPRGLTK